MAQEEKHLSAFIQRIDGFFKPVPNSRYGETQFDVDFLELKTMSLSLKGSLGDDYLSTAGQNPDNRKKNRYKDIAPFDATRVKLTASDDDPNSDYINASFIKGAENHRSYIASQGPLPHTVLDFWQMLWQYNVSVIVMVCREIELGKRKCERYWAQEGETKIFGTITVTLESDDALNDGYSLRVIKAVNGHETRLIKQFHYTSWPDHGVPKTCYEIISLINHVREVQPYSEDNEMPLCVHCSAGCGRTGAVIVVDYVRNMLSRKAVTADLKTYDIIAEMRRQRPALVQTKEQYEFVNIAIAELFKVYIRTKTLNREEFSAGYQGEEYVNINITNENNGRERHSFSQQYENIDPKPRPNGMANHESNDRAPPKPKRPVSTILPRSSASPYANYAQKQDAPPPPHQLQKPTPTTRSRGSHSVSSASNSSPTRSLPPTPTDTSKPKPPVASKPKPSLPRLLSPDVSKGIAKCGTSPLHDNTSAPDLSSGNHTSLSLTRSNNSKKNVTAHTQHSPASHPAPSPIREKAMLFERKDENRPPVRTSKPKLDTNKLKIREENDLTSESEAESPLTKGNFEEFNNPRPPVKPKPRTGVKVSKSVPMNIKENGTGFQIKKAAFEPVRRSNSKPKVTVRPVSQNFPVRSHSNDHNSGNSALFAELKKKPPPVMQKSAIVRSASLSIKKEVVQSNIRERRHKQNRSPNENKVQIMAKRMEGATVFFATTNGSQNQGAKPEIQHPKPCARKTVANSGGTGNNSPINALNPSYGLMDTKRTEKCDASNAKVDLSYQNHEVLPDNNSSGVDSRSYVNTKPKNNDPGNDQGHRKTSHGSVETSLAEELKTVAPAKPKRSLKTLQERSYSEDSSPDLSLSQDNFQSYQKKHLYYDVEFQQTKESVAENSSWSDLQSYSEDNLYNDSDLDVHGRRSSSSPSSLPPVVPMKTRESQMVLDEHPPVIPDRTEESYCYIQVNDTDAETYESVDTSVLAQSSSENAEGARRLSSAPSSSPSPLLNSAGVKNMMANVFDKTTSALSKVVSKTGDDTNLGAPSPTLEDRKPTYIPEPTIYNGHDMGFARRLLKKVRGPRKQKG